MLQLYDYKYSLNKKIFQLALIKTGRIILTLHINQNIYIFYSLFHFGFFPCHTSLCIMLSVSNCMTYNMKSGDGNNVVQEMCIRLSMSVVMRIGKSNSRTCQKPKSYLHDIISVVLFIVSTLSIESLCSYNTPFRIHIRSYCQNDKMLLEKKISFQIILDM